MTDDLVARARRLAAAAPPATGLDQVGVGTATPRVEPSPAAVELVASGQVEIVERSARRMLAEVEDGRRRHVRHEAGRWSCDCAAFVARLSCVHLSAVRLVAAAPGTRRLRSRSAAQRTSEALPW